MRTFQLDPIGVLMLSARLLYRQLPVWLQLNALALAASLPVVTLPAAQAALYATVRQGLTDELDASNPPHRAFWRAFRAYLRRATITLVLDAALGAVIAYSFVFWASSDIELLNYLAAVSAYFAIFWLVAQPLLLPVLVEYPTLGVTATLRRTALMVASRPVYTVLTAIMVYILAVLGVALLGPVLLVLGAFIALITIQVLWVLIDRPLPDPSREDAALKPRSKAHR